MFKFPLCRLKAVFLIVSISVLASTFLDSRDSSCNPPSGAIPAESKAARSDETTLIFAGIAGDAPRFIDSGPDKGTGWMDFETQEIRKGLRSDGFSVKEEWLTPARIEHEIKVGSPICTYPAKWSHPEQLFTKKPDRIYSLALDFTEEENQNIIFKTEKLPLFKRHADAQGAIRLEELLKDSSLKTLLVRDVNYGKFTSLLTQLDENNDQAVRKEYARHIELRVIKDNRQLIEMLNADRFDYLFSNAIEDEDFKKTGIPRERFTSIPFSSQTRVQDLDDPNLERISVMCSLHPMALAAIPSINRWVQVLRGTAWKVRKSDYRSQFQTERSGGHLPVHPNFYLVGRFTAQLKNGIADRWYALQQKQIPALSLLPQVLPKVEQQAERVIRPQEAPLWYSVPDGPQGMVLLKQTQFYRRKIEDANFFERALYTSNPNLGWNPIHLMLSAQTESSLKDFEEKVLWSQGRPLADLPLIVLGDQAASSVRKLTLFASGLSATTDFPKFATLFGLAPLEELTVIEANPDFLEASLNALLNHPHLRLRSLDLTNSSLSTPRARTALIQLLQKSIDLKKLHVDSTQLDEATWASLIATDGPLRERLTDLSASYLGAAWTEKNCALFGKSVWKKLESLQIVGNSMDVARQEALLPGLPQGLKSLSLKSHFYPRFRPSLAAALPQLETLHFERTNLIQKQGRIIAFPPSTQSISLIQSEFQGDQLRLPERIESLDLSDPWFPTREVGKALQRLGGKVRNLNLSKVGLLPEDLDALIQNEKITEIERLNLSWNGIDDQAVERLVQAKFQVYGLDLSKNRITNRGTALIAKRFLPKLRQLNLSENPILEAGSRSLAEALPKTLGTLRLSSLASIDLLSLSRFLPASLRRLDLANNFLSQDEIEALAKALPSGLKDLDLTGTGLSPKALVFLVESLPSGLTHLFLPSTLLEAAPAASLFARLPPHLSELEIGELTLDLKAASVVSQRMPLGLRELVMRGVKWQGTPAEIEQAQILFFSSFPSSLTRIKLYRTPVGIPAIKALSHHWPPNLRNFGMDGVGFGDEGMKILSATLPRTIDSLGLVGGGFTSKGLRELGTQPLENMVSLTLSLNSLSREGLEAVCSKPRVIQTFNLTAAGLHAQDLLGLNENCLRLLYTIQIGNNPIGNAGFIALLKKLSPYFQFINAPSIGITYEGLEKVIGALPPFLGGIELNGNSIGPLGYELLEKEARGRTRRGHPFFLMR